MTTDDSPPLLSGTLTVGTHRGRRVFFGISRTPPSARVPDEFGVNLFVPNADGENVSIARIDTHARVGCHVDRHYLPAEHPDYKHDSSVTVFSPEEAVSWFLDGDRWRRFVTEFDRNHGLPRRATDEHREE